MALLVGACTSSGSATPTRPTGATTPQDPAAVAAGSGSWRRIADVPIAPAGGMAAVWTGRHLVVWGGQPSGRTDAAAAAGAAYDPAAKRWRVLPAAPIPGRFGASAVWTGREVLIWGGQDGPDTTLADGAAYDPVARKWRTLPPAPIGSRAGHQAVWTGTEMVVWGGFARCCPVDSVLHDPAAAAYDPATDRWRGIASVPPPWSGDDGTGVSVVEGGRPLIGREGRLAAYDNVAGQWDEIAGAPTAPVPASGELVVRSTADPFAVGVATDGQVFVWTGAAGRLDGVAYRPAEPEPSLAWRRTAPLDAQSGGSITAGGPGRIYTATGQSTRILEYRIAEDRWEELPLPPIRTRSAAVLVWTGSELLFWGGMGDEGPEMDGAAWRSC